MQDKTFYYSRLKVSGWEKEEQITLSTQLILKAADKFGVQWKVLPGTKIIELLYQGITKYFRYQISSETTDIGFYTCLDKSVTNSLLREAGIQVPRGFDLTRRDPESYWLEVFDALQKPLVVKPSYGNQGNGITMGIKEKAAYIEAVKKSFAFLNDPKAGVMVEETVAGSEYRILVTREKVIGILSRVPANVVGDGQKTVRQLIEEKNSDPRRGTEDTFALFKIQLDEDVLGNIAEQGLTLESVLPEEKQLFVRKVSNIAKGGDSIDMTEVAHPSVSEIAVKAIRALPGLDFAGVDFMTQDITKPQESGTYTIIEVNSSPGFCIQEFPYLGTPRHGAEEFLYLSFPSLKELKSRT
jgi:glutamate--cysteine ligase